MSGRRWSRHDAVAMRALGLILLFVVSALGAVFLTRSIQDLVPDPPPPVRPIELSVPVTEAPPPSTAPDD